MTIIDALAATHAVQLGLHGAHEPVSAAEIGLDDPDIDFGAD